MCGIFCTLSRHGFIGPLDSTTQLLQNRGPDSLGQHQVVVEAGSREDAEASPRIHATFLSTVLSLRGKAIVEQPLRDASTGSILCWNGECWSMGAMAYITGNDSEPVLAQLLRASSKATSPEAAVVATMNLLATCRGPHAFVFYDARHKLVYYGRDCLGRRSLLQKTTLHGLVLSSVCDNASGDSWTEVDADGIYIVHLDAFASDGPSSLPRHVPRRLSSQADETKVSLTLPFPALNRSIKSFSPPDGDTAAALKRSLLDALRLRTFNVREAVSLTPSNNVAQPAKIAVLFSGGLDCTILARLCHDLLPITNSIDLLNVAFENPRIHSHLGADTSPYELCPDRITGRSSFAELQRVCPGRRWQFVAINVPYKDTKCHRTHVMTLMHPHNTEMDLSISYALYFASKGTGVINEGDHIAPTAYTTTARVLLSGLGADELFGGYQRHATAYERKGYAGLIDELELDFNRLGKRNLGRDDRVISDSGREVRFPFLDEDFISLALQLSAKTKCDFGSPQVEDSKNPALFLEPAKRALRVLAWKLDLKQVAGEKKRAIQFGARTAKMETGKTKGTHVLASV
ncbi:asparagine synthase-domain-containing protein [Ampelomyces quisqualis]|uniref:Asparagine synthase-domain-containing protein n=1 Tax=Ampelomyces quisqualis TaxID=50730 RepID=A0A6A5QYK2_AMPQU|nr:asparagine synthase-domain-containing protein [Ampelomyces quisqualis]